MNHDNDNLKDHDRLWAESMKTVCTPEYDAKVLENLIRLGKLEIIEAGEIEEA